MLTATLGAVGVAAVILVTLVLPAEYGVDPLGTGEALGLLGLSRQPPSAVTHQERTFHVDDVGFELAPFESVEYKYRLEAGSSLMYSWTASGEAIYDLHAEPDGAKPGFAESFARGRSVAENGTYVAPFPGIHGWFWENRGALPIRVELTTSGFYETATEFRDGWQTDRQPPAVRSRLQP